jgi:hypothetical protein
VKTDTLFIGGDRDGEWIGVDLNESVIRLPNKRQPTSLDRAADSAMKAFVEETLYRKSKLVDERGSFFAVFLAEGEDSVIGCLIEGYRKVK